jgi:DNA-binding PadR family transcriptional regulator
MSPAVFAHGHLRLYLLSLLAERSMHGYELIQALSDRFGGTYVPSAGTIYPRLAKLEEEGLVTKQVDGRKTVYAITDAGRAELAAREHELDGIESELTDSVRRLADEVRSSVDDAMRTLRADLAAATRDATQEARASGREERVDETRVRTRVQLHEAESAINEFRLDMRADLRATAADGVLDPAVVELLRTGLRQVRREVVAALRNAS